MPAIYRLFKSSLTRVCFFLFSFLFCFAAIFLMHPIEAQAVTSYPEDGAVDIHHDCKSHPGKLATFDDINAITGKYLQARGFKKAPSEKKTLPLVIISIGFNNMAYSNSYDWSEVIFNGDRSLEAFYSDMSLGKFTFAPAKESSAYGVGGNTNTADKVNDGIIHVNVNMAHDDWIELANADELLTMANAFKSAIEAADPYINFSQYDTDGNGALDNTEIAIGFAVGGYEASATTAYSSKGRNKYLWSHAWGVTDAFYEATGAWTRVKADNVRINSYIAIAESLDRNNTITQSPISLLSHELGHYLGLPDLYNTSMSSTGTWGAYQVGFLSVMAGGTWGTADDGSFQPAAMDAVCRAIMEWTEPVLIEHGETGSFDVPAQDYTADTYTSYQVNTARENEYYIVENRQYNKWDEVLSKSNAYSAAGSRGGLVLWHVDEDEYDAYIDDNGINNVEHRPSIMPLYPERQNSNLTMISNGQSVSTSMPFFSSTKWAAYYQPTFGDKLALPLYGSGVSADTPLSRTLSDVELLFPDASSTSMSFVIGCDHQLERHAAVAATCTTNGNIEYWTCSKCGRFFSESKGNTEIEESATVVNAPGHNAQYHAAVAATCTASGNIQYWTCSRCGKYFSNSDCSTEIQYSQTRLSALGHNITHHAAVDASCTSSGNIEYWTCSRCGKYFLDSVGNTATTASAVSISVLGHNMTHHAAVAATCTTSGNIEYWTCSRCGKYFLDSAGNNATTASAVNRSALGHSLTHYAGTASTCSQHGLAEHWKCERCNKYFSNSSGTVEISQSSLELPLANHAIVHHDAVGSTCSKQGNIEYWTCSTCNKVFLDDSGNQVTTASAVMLPLASHSTVHHSVQSATCQQEGLKDHWECTACGKLFSTKNATTEISLSELVIPKAAHQMEHHAAQPAICSEDGTVEYWHCFVCGNDYSDAEGNIRITNIVQAAKGHSLTRYPAVAASCTASGSREYWKCSSCGKLFSNSAGTQETTLSAVTLAPLGHSLVHHDAVAAGYNKQGNVEYWQCSRCSDVFLDASATNKTTLAATVLPAYTNPFSDVTTKTDHMDEVLWLANTGISAGWTEKNGSKTFRPYNDVARADMAAFLFRLGVKWGVVSENWQASKTQRKAFTDVDESTSHAQEIWWLASTGISTGWTEKNGSKTFRPLETVKRQDMAAFLFRLAKLAGKGGASDTWKASSSSQSKFKDVAANDADNHHTEVWWLAEKGVSQGWSVGGSKYEFRGLKNVARCDMAAFLQRMDSL